jgi:hypothetical protein
MADRRITGYADLTFAESAHLALARAGEIAQTDVEVQHPAAFAIEDRRLQFSIDANASPIEIDGFRRLLEALVRDATTGEASLEVETGERWAQRAPDGGRARSGAEGLAAATSGTTELDESETRPTMRTGAG